MRDRNDNVVIVCSIENLDPMGVHTAPAFGRPADDALGRGIPGACDSGGGDRPGRRGVETGGVNIQFARDCARAAPCG